MPRAGYRLIETPPAADAEQGAIAAGEAPSQVSVRGRRRIAVAAGLVVVSGAGGLLAFERFMQPEPDAVMLTPFDVAGNAPLARTFAAGVSAEVNSALSAAGVDVLELDTALIDDGHLSEARARVERAVRIWPDDTMLQVVNLDYQARFGDPEAALAIVNDPAARPQEVRDITLAAYRHLAEARKANNPEQTRAFIAWLKQEVAAGQLGADFAAPHIAQFGDVDGAFRFAFAAPADIINVDPEFLWEPEALPLRRDPRFIALAAKFHVADFWTSTGLWPDFCSTPNWPYNCRAVLARLRANARAKA